MEGGQVQTRNKYAAFLIHYKPATVKDLPLVSPYAMAISSKHPTMEVDFADVHQAFCTDPFLAAKICGVSNSIFFNLKHSQILTVSQAIKRVGLDYARKLIIAAPPAPAGVTRHEVMEYWIHCMLVAYASKEIARVVDVELPLDSASLLGLIHDIGYLVELSYNPQLMADVLASIRGGEMAPNNDTHATLACSLTEFWSLPKLAQDALKGHHELSRCTTEPGRRLAALLRIADALALDTTLDEAEDKTALTMLNLSERMLWPIQTEVRHVHRELTSMALAA